MALSGPKSKKKKIRMIILIILSRVSYLIDTDGSTSLGSGTYQEFEDRLAEAKKCFDCAPVDDVDWSDEETAVGDVIEELAEVAGVVSAATLADWSDDLEATLVAYRESLVSSED